MPWVITNQGDMVATNFVIAIETIVILFTRCFACVHVEVAAIRQGRVDFDFRIEGEYLSGCEYA